MTKDDVTAHLTQTTFDKTRKYTINQNCCAKSSQMKLRVHILQHKSQQLQKDYQMGINKSNPGSALSSITLLKSFLIYQVKICTI